MFYHKDFVEESIEKAAESAFRASLQISFIEDILTVLDLYPNVNGYLDYALNCDVRETVSELQEKIEKLRKKVERLV